MGPPSLLPRSFGSRSFSSLTTFTTVDRDAEQDAPAEERGEEDEQPERPSQDGDEC